MCYTFLGGAMSTSKERIYEFIKAYISKKGYAPSVREIGNAVGLKSTSSVSLYLKELHDDGLIRRDPAARAIDISFDESSAPRHESDSSIVQVPVVGEIAAGQPILAEQNISDYIPVSGDFIGSGTYFMLIVKGDSMIEKGIFNKDYVLIRQQNTAENGQIVAALLDDSATVKTYYKENGRIRLQPENSSMSPIYTEYLDILGIVKGVFRKL